MKKMMMAACAIAMLGLFGCKKDNPTPDNGGQGGGGGDQFPTGEGIYNPSHKIATVSVDGTLSETWTWNDWQLVSITTEGDEGSTSTFEYEGYRLSSALSSFYGVPALLSYTYAGDKLSSINAGNMAEIFVTHNTAEKIDSLKIDMDPVMVNQLLNMLLSYMGNGGTKDFGSKLTVTSTDVAAALTWQGDNVSQMLLNGEIVGTATLGEIRSIINLDSLAGTYASLLSLLSDETLIPLTLVLNETTGFTYDNQHNPLCGFFGRLDPSMLSASNITQQTTEGSVTITATLTTPLGNLSLPYTYDIPSSNQSLSYTYDNDGYPLTVTNGDGSVTSYTYK